MHRTESKRVAVSLSAAMLARSASLEEGIGGPMIAGLLITGPRMGSQDTTIEAVCEGMGRAILKVEDSLERSVW